MVLMFLLFHGIREGCFDGCRTVVFDTRSTYPDLEMKYLGLDWEERIRPLYNLNEMDDAERGEFLAKHRDRLIYLYPAPPWAEEILTRDEKRIRKEHREAEEDAVDHDAKKEVNEDKEEEDDRSSSLPWMGLILDLLTVQRRRQKMPPRLVPLHEDPLDYECGVETPPKRPRDCVVDPNRPPFWIATQSRKFKTLYQDEHQYTAHWCFIH